jgi:hypothetical protein
VITASDARIATLIGTRIDEYGPAFERLAGGRWVVWNWCAFTFGPVWALYRRMYLLAFASILLAIAIHLAPALWPAGAAFSNTVVWGSLLFGAFGNRALWLHTQRRLAKAKRLSAGPNRYAVWVLVALILIVFVVNRL